MNLANIKNWESDQWAGLFFGIIAYGGLIIGLTSLCFALFSSKQITHCYLIMGNSDSSLYEIRGNVEWDNDPLLGKGKNFEETNELMLKVCPVKGH